MSGHSHAKTVKRVKEAGDKKRGQIFSKISRLISVAVREGGSSPESNSKLKPVIEMAKRFNMPKDNIERAIKRGSGEIQEEKLEEVLFEAYGPAGIAVIVEGITDNKNRSLGEIKQILNQYDGKLVSEGSVRWLFEKMGCLTVDYKSPVEGLKNKEKIELLAIDGGAQDFNWDEEEVLNIYTKVEDLEKIKKNLEENGVKIESTALGWIAKEQIELNEKQKKSCQKLFEALDENEAVQEIYSNLKV